MKNIQTIFFVIILQATIYATTIHVGFQYTYSNLEDAISIVTPGDTILFHEGIYTGSQYVNQLYGTKTEWIYIMAQPNDSVIIRGGSYGWHLANVRHINISGFIFEYQLNNGMNIDDGGDYTSPSHSVNVVSCKILIIQFSGLKIVLFTTFELIHPTKQ